MSWTSHLKIPPHVSLWMKEPRNQQRTLAAVIATTTAVTALYYLATRNNNKKTRQSLPPCPPNVPVKVWKAFESAVTRIQNIKSVRSGDKLMLYALYKQACLGDAPAENANKSWNVVVEQAKYTQWCRLRGMSQEEAAVHYATAVAGLEDEFAKYGGAEEGEELDLAPAVSRPIEEEPVLLDTSLEAQFLLAASQNDTDRLREILNDDEKRAEKIVNHADDAGQTALHMAADRGAEACVKLLLQEGANVAACDKDGISVLQAAVIAGHAETCKLLLSAGADPDQEDMDGDTPRSCAQDDGSGEMMELFYMEA